MTTPLTTPFREYLAVSPRYRRRSSAATVVAAVGMLLVAPGAALAGWTVVSAAGVVVGWSAVVVAAVTLSRWEATYRAATVAATPRVERTDPPHG